jgi:flagellar L-ring protein precursor FlgH
MTTTRAVVLAALLTLVTALPAAAQSLYREGAQGAGLFADRRARAVDDVVTILIDERSASSRAAETKTSKDTARAAAVNQFPTAFDPIARKVARPIVKGALGSYESPSEFLTGRLGLDLDASASHQGKGSIDRSDRVTGQIAARVVKVLDNGHLLIEGRRSVLVNDETQVITISGIVRPDDVTGANTVLSSQIADAEVQMVGQGVLAEAQRPGIIFRLLDWLRLF